MDDADRLAADATRWLADARIDEAARARSRERWLRQQAQEEATFTGLLLALAEAAEHVEVGLAGGPAFTGAVLAVGADYVELATGSGRRTWVALAAIAAVVRAGPAGVASDARRGRSDRRLWTVLADAAGDRPDVAVFAGGPEHLGELIGVGDDVLTLLAEGRAIYVPSRSVGAVSLRSSG